MNPKKRNFLWLNLCALVVAAVGLFGFLLSQKQGPLQLDFILNDHRISVWKGEGEAFLFLPGWAELSEVTAGREFELNGIDYEAGDSLDGLNLGEAYPLKVGGKTTTLTLVRSGKIPTLFIDTATGRLDTLLRSKNNQEEGKILLLSASGETELSSGLEWISGRGNMTWSLAKKGWGFKLPAAAPLLGMNVSDKWVLLANAYDATRGLRNYAALHMAQETGLEYSRDLRFVELYLNGEYVGLYQLAEKITQGEDALDLGDLDAANARANSAQHLRPEKMVIHRETDENGVIVKSWAALQSPLDYSGGYILERNFGYKLEDKLFQFATEEKESFVVRYPSLVTKQEADYISELMQQIENALLDPDYVDRTTGKNLAELIDLDSWARRYVLDETVKNEGMGATSCYYYKKQGDDVIYAGPVWDYDKSFGSIAAFLSPEGLTYGSLHLDYSPWLKQFYSNPEAQALIRRYYVEVYRPYLLELAQGRVRTWSEDIRQAFETDWLRWNEEYVTYPTSEWQTGGGIGSLDAAVEFMEEWIIQRIDFLDRVWIDDAVYYTVCVPKYGILFVLPEGADLSEVGRELGDEYVDAETGLVPDYSQSIHRDYRLMPAPAVPDTSASAVLRRWGRLLALPAGLAGILFIMVFVDYRGRKRG